MSALEDDFRFLLLCKLRVGSPVNSSDEKFNHLVVSNKYGVVLCASNRELKYVSISTIDDFGAKKNYVLNEGNDFEYGSTTVQGNITYLGINCDETYLFVVYKVDRKLVLVALSLECLVTESMNSPVVASVELPADCSLVDLKCHPESSSLLALCLSNGVVCLYEVQGNQIVMTGILSQGPQATSICWSPKGKQIVVGKKSGEIVQYDKTLKVVKKTTASGCTIEAETHRVAAIHWISSYVFFIVYDADDKVTPPECMVIKTQRDGPTAYFSLQDIFYGFSDDRLLYYYLQFLPEWNILVAMASNAMESVPVGYSNENWARWQLDDICRAEIPLNSDNDDCYPVGMGICYNSKLDVIEGDKQSPPVPIFFVLSNDGVVCSYQMINTFPDASKQITRPLARYIQFKKKQSQDVPQTNSTDNQSQFSLKISSAPPFGGNNLFTSEKPSNTALFPSQTSDSTSTVSTAANPSFFSTSLQSANKPGLFGNQVSDSSSIFSKPLPPLESNKTLFSTKPSQSIENPFMKPTVSTESGQKTPFFSLASTVSVSPLFSMSPAASSKPSIFAPTSQATADTNKPSIFAPTSQATACITKPSIFAPNSQAPATTSKTSIFGPNSQAPVSTSKPSIFVPSSQATAGTTRPSIFASTSQATAGTTKPSIFAPTSQTSNTQLFTPTAPPTGTSFKPSAASSSFPSMTETPSKNIFQSAPPPNQSPFQAKPSNATFSGFQAINKTPVKPAQPNPQPATANIGAGLSNQSTAQTPQKAYADSTDHASTTNNDLQKCEEQLNHVIEKSISEEINTFNAEMESFTQGFNEFVDWSENFTKNQDLTSLNKNVQNLRGYVKTHENIMSENKAECNELREKILGMFSTVDEAVIRKNKLDSTIYSSTMKDRPLDPISKQQLKAVYSSMQYIETQLSDINDTLTTKMRSNVKQKFTGSKRQSTESINRTVDMISAITNQLSVALHQISLDNMEQNVARSRISTSSASRSSNEKSQNHSGGESHPKKVSQLRYFLSKREKPKPKKANQSTAHKNLATPRTQASNTFNVNRFPVKSGDGGDTFLSSRTTSYSKGVTASSPFVRPDSNMSSKANNFVIPGSITPIVPQTKSLNRGKPNNVLPKLKEDTQSDVKLDLSKPTSTVSSVKDIPGKSLSTNPPSSQSGVLEHENLTKDTFIKDRREPAFQLNSTPKEQMQPKVSLATSQPTTTVAFGSSFTTPSLTEATTIMQQKQFPPKDTFSFGGQQTRSENLKNESQQKSEFSFASQPQKSETATSKGLFSFTTAVSKNASLPQQKGLFSFNNTTKQEVSSNVQQPKESFSFSAVQSSTETPVTSTQTKGIFSLVKASDKVEESKTASAVNESPFSSLIKPDKNNSIFGFGKVEEKKPEEQECKTFLNSNDTEEKKDIIKPRENPLFNNATTEQFQEKTSDFGKGFSFGSLTSQSKDTFSFGGPQKPVDNEQKPEESDDKPVVTTTQLFQPPKEAIATEAPAKPFGNQQLFTPKQTLSFTPSITKSESAKPLFSAVTTSANISNVVATPVNITPATSAPAVETLSNSFGFSTPSQKEEPTKGFSFGLGGKPTDPNAINPMFQPAPSIFSQTSDSTKPVFGTNQGFGFGGSNSFGVDKKDDNNAASKSGGGVLGSSVFGVNMEKKKENESSGFFSKGFGFGLLNNSATEGTTTQQTNNAGFGGAAVFGGSPFGSTSAFGAAPSFGAAPAFGSPPAFGSAPAFGSPPAFGSSSPFGGGMSNSASMTPFGSSGGSNMPTFGSLSQGSSVFGGGSSNAPSFQSLATQGGPSIGGGGGMFGSNNNAGTNMFGGSNNNDNSKSMSGSSFTSWR